MKKKNQFNIQNLIEDLKRTSKLLKETYVFNEEDDEPMEEPMPFDGEEEAIDPMAQNKTDDIIDQIRQLALDGIQEYAEDVDNEYYQTYKKIWMMCDKCLSEKDKVEQ